MKPTLLTSGGTRGHTSVMPKVKRPRDSNQLAKLMVDIATGQVAEDASEEADPAMALARKGGQKGGEARAAKLSPRERSEIASLAAQARWRKRD